MMTYCDYCGGVSESDPDGTRHRICLRCAEYAERVGQNYFAWEAIGGRDHALTPIRPERSKAVAP
jgi:hypothetical protein